MFISACLAILVYAALNKVCDWLERTGCLFAILLIFALSMLAFKCIVAVEQEFWSILNL